MKAIDFVVRTRAGATQYGAVSEQDSVTTFDAGQGQEVSLNLRQIDVDGYARSGNDLQITLADGRVVVLENYFAGGGEARVFLSANGYLNEVTLTEGQDGTLYAQYGPTDQWGKWSPSDDLIFLGESEVAAAEGEEDDDGTVAMLGAGILGGTGLLGAAGAGAAAIAATTVASELGDNDGGGGPARVTPKVDQDTDIEVGGDDAGAGNSTMTISGEAEPGSTVRVTVGEEMLETTSGDDGKWQVTFEGESFPGDGDHTVTVAVIEPDGTETTLTGPNVTIDTTPPSTDVTEGVSSTGDIINAAEFGAGTEITGTGEAGSAVEVTIQDVTRETVVTGDGTWRVTFEQGTLQPGEYDTEVTVVARDGAGNTTTITETLRIDTVANEVGISTATIGGDGVVNAAELAAGVDITGSATPGSVINVTVEGVERTVTAGEAGNWTATYAQGKLPGGTYDATITATTTDQAGNVNTTTGTIRIDTQVENFGIISQPGGADGVMNAAEAAAGLVVTGSSEAGSTVSVQLGNATVQAVVGADGSWTASFAAAQIPAGTYTEQMIATATDAAGNTRTLTRTVLVDTEAGALTIDAGRIGGDGTINAAEAQAGVVVSGTAEPGAVVTVTMDGVTHQAVAGANGVWQTTYAQQEITPGVHDPQITATVTDAAGNIANASATVHVDTRVDNLGLAPPQIGVSVDGSNVINDAVASSGFDITGTVEPGSTVTVTIAGVAQQAVVDADGNWTANFPSGSIPPGEYDAPLVVDVTDAAGNTSSVNDTVRVDTLVNALDRTGAIETDNMVNAAEALDGVTVGGRVEAGSTVAVEVLGKTYDAVVDADGNWTLDIPAGDIPQGVEQGFAMVVTATDRAGNTSTVNDTLIIDTLVPDQPDIVGYFREGGGYRSVTLETPDDPVEIHQIDAGGAVNQMAVHESVDQFLGETDYHFLDGAGAATRIPDGSQLIVTSTDAAGNASSTYVVLDETDTSVVNVSNPNLAGFQIETVDLRFGDQSELTLTDAQIRALSDSTDTVVVHGGADDRVTVTGAQRGGQVQVDGERHDIYTLGNDGATIVVDDDINVIT